MGAAGSAEVDKGEAGQWVVKEGAEKVAVEEAGERAVGVVVVERWRGGRGWRRAERRRRGWWRGRRRGRRW